MVIFLHSGMSRAIHPQEFSKAAVDKVHRTPVESGRGLCRGLNVKRHFKCGDDNVPYANGDDNVPYAFHMQMVMIMLHTQMVMIMLHTQMARLVMIRWAWAVKCTLTP